MDSDGKYTIEDMPEVLQRHFEDAPYGYDCNGRKIRVVKESFCEGCGRLTGQDLSDGSMVSSGCGCDSLKDKLGFKVQAEETYTFSPGLIKGVVFFDESGKEIGRKLFDALTDLSSSLKIPKSCDGIKFLNSKSKF